MGKYEWSGGSNVRAATGSDYQFCRDVLFRQRITYEEDKEWLENGWYENRYTYQLPDAEHSKYFIKSGQLSALLHFHRSLRFYASVGFDGGLWEGRLKTLANSSYASFQSGKGCGEKIMELTVHSP